MSDQTPQYVIQLIPVNRIMPSRYQTRKDFDENSLKSLAESIKNEGLEQAVMVRRIPAPNPLPAGFTSPDGGWFELIFGERRLRAHRLAGLDVIEAKVVEVVSEAAAAAKAMVENTQKADLNPIEEAENFDILNRLDSGYWTHDRIADTADKSREYITKSIGILKLSEAVKNNVRRRTLSRSHAIEIARIPEVSLQEQAAKTIIAGDLNREATRKLIDKMLGNPEKAGDQAKGAKTDGKANGNGVRIAKAGKNIRIEIVVPAGTPPDAIAKPVTDAYQQWLTEQAQKSKIRQPLGEPQARRPSGKSKPASYIGKQTPPDGQAKGPEKKEGMGKVVGTPLTPSPHVLGEGGDEGNGLPAEAHPLISSPLGGEDSGEGRRASGADASERGGQTAAFPAELFKLENEMLETLRKLAADPATRPMAEMQAKALGFATPEEYIAKIEEKMKRSGGS